jgi:hypothetical protein
MRCIDYRERAMKPAIDEIFVPCGWARATIRDDKIAFTRGQDRLTLVAELVDESTATSRICTGPIWRISCKQRVGEAESGIQLDCVTTVNTAMETLLTHMRRINEIAGIEGGISVGTMLELLRDGSVPDGRDEWGRTPSNQLDTQPSNP